MPQLPVKIDPKKARVAGAAAGALLLLWILWKVFGGGYLYAGTVEATEVDLSARVSSVIALSGDDSSIPSRRYRSTRSARFSGAIGRPPRMSA